MSQFLLNLALFSSKAIIITLIILIIMLAFFILVAKSKEKIKGRLVIKNLNKKYAETSEALMQETLSKKQFKKFLKERKAEEKAKEAASEKTRNVYVINFEGDIKASAVPSLSEEVTAILNVASPSD